MGRQEPLEWRHCINYIANAKAVQAVDGFPMADWLETYRPCGCRRLSRKGVGDVV